ncbi:MAG TPA: diacylglycerol kinase family protein, partial [Verrucomicrobiota bacterium]|nr:diacylglycerol kinase family protein [Verrucomicrobiota bacterium]
EAAAPNYDTLVAVGGDGTVNEVLNGLLRSGSNRPSLAVLPLGTGNDVAAQLGVAEETAAVRTAFSGDRWKMDVIDVECRGIHGETRRFSSVMYVALGIAGAMGQLTTPWMKRWLGARWCYSAGFVRALVQQREVPMRIEADERVFQGPMLLAAVGNVEAIGGGTFRLFPGAVSDDGQMEVNVVSHLSRGETLRCFGKVQTGTHPAHPRVEYFRAKRVMIESDPPLPLNFDGEVGGLTPVTLTLRAKALPVLRAERSHGATG